MKMEEIKREFIRENKDYILNNINDIISINFEYTCYIDGLCKDGLITQRQYNSGNNHISKNDIKKYIF